MTPSASFWATRLFQLLLLPLMPLLLLLCLANVSCVLSLPTFLISYFSRPAWLAEKLKCCARKRKCQLKSEDNSRAAPTTANFRILSFLRVCSVAFAPVASLQVFPPFASAATGSNKRQKLLQFLLRLMVGWLGSSFVGCLYGSLGGPDGSRFRALLLLFSFVFHHICFCQLRPKWKVIYKWRKCQQQRNNEEITFAMNLLIWLF